MSGQLRYYIALNGRMKVMQGHSGSMNEVGEFFEGRTLEHLTGWRRRRTRRRARAGRGRSLPAPR